MNLKDPISLKLLDILQRQESKGLETYNQNLADCPDEDYNWNIMLIEELIDGLKYSIKENLRLKQELVRLQNFGKDTITVHKPTKRTGDHEGWETNEYEGPVRLYCNVDLNDPNMLKKLKNIISKYEKTPNINYENVFFGKPPYADVDD